MFLNPMATLCSRAGNLSEGKWHQYAAGEPVLKACGP
jgi:hypothetical protein